MDVLAEEQIVNRQVKLNELADVLGEVEYPISHDDAVAACRGVTLTLSEGEENLGDLLAGSDADRFGSQDELRNEIMTLLPRHAVGEPYQSEGEG